MHIIYRKFFLTFCDWKETIWTSWPKRKDNIKICIKEIANAWERRGMYTGFWWESQKERDQ
jgi:hypothetical protein